MAETQRSTNLLQGKAPMLHLSICLKVTHRSVHNYFHCTVTYSSKRQNTSQMSIRGNTCYGLMYHMPWEDSLQLRARKVPAGGRKSCTQSCLEKGCSLRASGLHSRPPRRMGKEGGRSYQRQVAQAHRKKWKKIPD